MKCHEAEKWILLQDSGEMPEKRANPLAAHLHDCDPCQRFQHALMESRDAVQTADEPSIKAIQNVLRAARVNTPEKRHHPIWALKPAIALAASVVIGLGLFFGSMGPDKVGMEFVVTETQLLDADDQIVSVMYDGMSDDDLAFSFLMTYEDSFASL